MLWMARLGALFAAVLLLSTVATAAPQDFVVQVRTPTVPAVAGNGWLEVAVTDAAGTVSPADTVVMLKKASGPVRDLSADVQLWRNEDGSFGLDFRKLEPQLGLYTLTFEVSLGSQTTSLDAQVAFAGEIEVTDMQVGVEVGGSRDVQRLVHPQPLPETLSLADVDRSAKAVVAFTVRQAGRSSFAPHQALVRVTHAASGAAAFVRAKRGDAGAHRAALSAEDITAQAGGRGGLYELALLLGDAGVSNPIEWSLGQVEVPEGKGEAAAAVGLKKDIRHVFRLPTKNPPIVISVFFAGAQVAIFLALLYVVAGIRGISLRGVPRSAGGVLAALGFHGGVFGILALYLVFWVRLSILQLLPLLAVAGPVTAVFGYFLLSNLASSRVKAD